MGLKLIHLPEYNFEFNKNKIVLVNRNLLFALSFLFIVLTYYKSIKDGLILIESSSVIKELYYYQIGVFTLIMLKIALLVLCIYYSAKNHNAWKNIFLSLFLFLTFYQILNSAIQFKYQFIEFIDKKNIFILIISISLFIMVFDIIRRNSKTLTDIMVRFIYKLAIFLIYYVLNILFENYLDSYIDKYYS
jgi:hypothetical protein